MQGQAFINGLNLHPDEFDFFRIHQILHFLFNNQEPFFITTGCMQDKRNLYGVD